MEIGDWSVTITKNEKTVQSGDESDAARSDLPDRVTISNERELLFRQVQNDQHALWKTYNRYYTGARYVGYLSWAATATTAIIGAILLALISGTPGWWIFTESVVTLLLVAVSLLSAFYSPQARSAKYYSSGQRLQEIYDEYENFVNLEIADRSQDIQTLKNEYERLHRRRHLANQGAPQLSGIWYQILNWLLGDGLWSKLLGFFSTIKREFLELFSLPLGKDKAETDDLSDNGKQPRYQHSCGTDKRQWEETLCEKIVNYGHPPAHSEQSGE